MLGEKGKHASATENRRFVWSKIVWPLVLDLGEVSFSLKQFQERRNHVCRYYSIGIQTPSRGLVSLVQKGLLVKEDDTYSIHFRLIPYMRLRADCDYATAIHEVKIK